MQIRRKAFLLGQSEREYTQDLQKRKHLDLVRLVRKGLLALLALAYIAPNYRIGPTGLVPGSIYYGGWEGGRLPSLVEFLVILILPLCLLFSEKSPKKWVFDRLDWAAVILVVCVSVRELSLYGSTVPRAQGVYRIGWFLPLLSFIIIRQSAWSASEIRFFVTFIFCSASIQSLSMLFPSIFPSDWMPAPKYGNILYDFSGRPVYGVARASGFWITNTHATEFLLFCLGLAYGLSWEDVGRRILRNGLLTLFIGAIVVSVQRGYLLVLFAMLALVLLQPVIRRLGLPRRHTTELLFLLLALGLFLLLRPYVLYRFMWEDWQSTNRDLIWGGYLRAIYLNPLESMLIGNGLGNHAFDDLGRVLVDGHAHNMWLSLWLNIGLPLTIMYGSMLYGIGRHVANGSQHQTESRTGLESGFLLAWVSFFLCSVQGPVIFVGQNAILYFILAGMFTRHRIVGESHFARATSISARHSRLRKMLPTPADLHLRGQF